MIVSIYAIKISHFLRMSPSIIVIILGRNIFVDCGYAAFGHYASWAARDDKESLARRIKIRIMAN